MLIHVFWSVDIKQREIKTIPIGTLFETVDI